MGLYGDFNKPDGDDENKSRWGMFKSFIQGVADTFGVFSDKIKSTITNLSGNTPDFIYVEMSDSLDRAAQSSIVSKLGGNQLLSVEHLLPNQNKLTTDYRLVSQLTYKSKATGLDVTRTFALDTNTLMTKSQIEALTAQVFFESESDPPEEVYSVSLIRGYSR